MALTEEQEKVIYAAGNAFHRMFNRTLKWSDDTEDGSVIVEGKVIRYKKRDAMWVALHRCYYDFESAVLAVVDSKMSEMFYEVYKEEIDG